MSDESFETGKCSVCGNVLSLEVGITNYGSEGDSKLYCTPCAPNRGKGYTLSDLERWREDNQVERAKYEMSIMELVGPDVYFAIKGRRLEPWMRLERMKSRMRQKLRELGVEVDNIDVPGEE